jgi:hypothetical protein
MRRQRGRGTRGGMITRHLFLRSFAPSGIPGSVSLDRVAGFLGLRGLSRVGRRLRRSGVPALGAVLLAAGAASADVPREWRFDVFLDDRAIGEQSFRVTEEDGRTRVAIEADLEVKILFYTAYAYRHRNVEVWDGDCLHSIDSTTDDNGKPFRVRGLREGEAFVVNTASARESVLECVRAFAYWDRERLRGSRLLNSQTGEIEEVRIRSNGSETLRFRGQDVAAERIALEGPGLKIDLWYSTDGDWLALESDSKGGRRLRYVRR